MSLWPAERCPIRKSSLLILDKIQIRCPVAAAAGHGVEVFLEIRINYKKITATGRPSVRPLAVDRHRPNIVQSNTSLYLWP